MPLLTDVWISTTAGPLASMGTISVRTCFGSLVFFFGLCNHVRNLFRVKVFSQLFIISFIIAIHLGLF